MFQSNYLQSKYLLIKAATGKLSNKTFSFSNAFNLVAELQLSALLPFCLKTKIFI